jgi:hypothetical protein
MGLHASVKEHLNALEEAPEWVVSLGEMIQRADGCSAAIAASRARDLSQRKDIGEAIEGIARGWEILSGCDLGSLTPLQRETIEVLVSDITKGLETRLLQSGRMKR